MSPYRTARKPLLDEVVELVRFDIADDSRDLPSLAIRPQDRVHVDIRHAAPKLQVEFETVKNARADSRPARVGFSKSRTADTITAAPRRR